MITPILQFGTSRLLQAHADLFVSEALPRGAALGKITVVQTTGAPERAGRLSALARPGGFPVVVRGLVNGKPVDRSQQVTSVGRCFSAEAHWTEVAEIAADEAIVFISNTGERGYEVDDAEDTGPVPRSFPGKLLALLHGRYLRRGRPLSILPTELIPRNGEVLKAVVLDLADRRINDPAFRDWLTRKVIWASTLVDRIVSEPLEPAGAVAEPYALWAIENQPGLVLPCHHPAVRLVDTLEPYERLKLHILNLGHSFLVESWTPAEDPALVKDYLAVPEVRERLIHVYEDEVVPGFQRRNMGDEARLYIRQTLERFDNPYLKHKLSDIQQNHSEKVRRRIGGFLEWSGLSHAPELSAIARRYANI